jgi:protein NirF
MKRTLLLILLAALSLLAACTTTPSPAPRGTGDLGTVIARATGTLAIVNTTQRSLLGQVGGLGDLSHASVVYSRDGLDRKSVV